MPAPTGPMPSLQTAAPMTMASPRTASPTPSRRCSGASGSASSGWATERARPPAPRASRFQPPAITPQSPVFSSAGQPAAGGGALGGRPLAQAVDPERLRGAAYPAGRRLDVVRAGMRRTVIALGAPAPQAGARVPRRDADHLRQGPASALPPPRQLADPCHLRARGARGRPPRRGVVDGDDVWWSEARPAEAGRSALVRLSGAGAATDVLPPPWNARTRVHEYGGGAWTVAGGTLWFTDFADQRLYRLDAGERRAGSGHPGPAGARRSAARRPLGHSRAAGCSPSVRRTPRAARPPTSSTRSSGIEARRDDVRPGQRPGLRRRPAARARRRHAVVAAVGPPAHAVGRRAARRPRPPTAPSTCSAGGPGESVVQPVWARRTDAVVGSATGPTSGRCTAGARTATSSSCVDVGSDIGGPQWVFGQSRYALLDDGRIVLAYGRAGADRLAVVTPGGEPARARPALRRVRPDPAQGTRSSAWPAAPTPSRWCCG